MFFKKRKGNDVVPENLPVHIGFIMDGNGRWAKKRGLPRQYGHKEGANAFKKIVRYCKDIGIKYITFYAFSTENWKRPKEEVDAILMLFRQYLSEVREHIGEEVKVVFLGDKDAFDDELKNEMLGIIFRESVQPYMISWLKYNPQQEIAKLKIPTLIVNGTKDMQVSVGEAELLKAAKPDAKLEIITNMNHIFKEINGDEAENIASYSKPEIPIITQIPTIVTGFVKSL